MMRHCEQPGCTIRPSFGDETNRPRFCKGHAPEGMCNVVSRLREREECSDQPIR